MATRRGSRTITTNDLFFLIRHDKAKTSRLMTFLSWKDVRKTARDSDDKGADAADAADDALGGGDVAGKAPLSWIVQGLQHQFFVIAIFMNFVVLIWTFAGGPTAPIGELTKRSKKKIKLPWDITSFYNEQLPEGDDDDDEEEQEANAATLERLHQADKRTKDMSRDQYVHYSDCRQASFTYKKAKRFREWAGFGVVTDSKPNDDIVDILGFLLYDIVQALTEEALKVKHEEDRPKERAGESDQSKKRKRQTGLFDPPEEGTIPVTTKHVREAFRRLQEKPIPGRSRVWLGSKGLQKTELRLVGHNRLTFEWQ